MEKTKGLPTHPFVTVVTPTFNRRKFIPSLIAIYKSQTYPKEHMEWIIYDDGTDKVEDMFKNLPFPNVRYIYDPEKKNIGAKRNLLNDLAKGQIIVAIDDDDYYPPDRVSHCVYKFRQFPDAQMAGAIEMFMYYTDIKIIYALGPYHPSAVTNGTMAWRDTYKHNRYDEGVTHAEETSFLTEMRDKPMIALDPMKTILVMSHSSNTYDKVQLRNNKDPFLKESTMKLRDVIKDKKLREFFASI
jgi:glycosyltransferase involved in cell wall biosynthesis